MACEWWKQAVIYQVYPRSFQDSNSDGIGDIPGIISRLDYLQELGIDAIWLSPVCKSPQDDNGYDISDYRDIDPLFGRLEDMDRLIEEAKKRNIRIIMDLVLNHSSDEHFWFKEALKGRDNKYHDYYIWQDGEEGVYPNDMMSGFGGHAWQWVPSLKQYYFHHFSVKQPDLNWDNPAMRQELYDMINWWIDRGIGGFRLDVIDHIGKNPLKKVIINKDKTHQYIQELSQNTFGRKPEELVSVGEAWSASLEEAPRYSGPDSNELSMVFQFEHILLDNHGHDKFDLKPLSLADLKQVLGKWQTGLHGKGWNSLFWDNHDLPRIVSRWGNDSEEYREKSAKMLATLLHGMEGTPYIYQGEELGMTNTPFDLNQYRDIETLNAYKEHKALGWSEDRIVEALHARSRDNARTPMQWDGSVNAGFTKGEPWIVVNPNYQKINAAAQMNDPDSVLAHYKKLIRLRKEKPVFTEGLFEMLLAEDEEVFAYRRVSETSTLTVICNFYGNAKKVDMSQFLPEGSLPVLTNDRDNQENMSILNPYEARMYITTNH
ncbi:MAG: alpha-glucosidase [Lachnospiraceae bacterium]|nr:alpha-glucosidase [Candidatus Equihabitans merdae]